MRSMDDSHPSDCFATIYGITDNKISNKLIERYCAVFPFKDGKCLCIYPEYARVLEQPTSINSGTQLQDYGNKNSDISTLLDCGQYLITPTGHIFPFIIEGGLCYLPQQLPTNCEMSVVLQVLMTLSKHGILQFIILGVQLRNFSAAFLPFLLVHVKTCTKKKGTLF